MNRDDLVRELAPIAAQVTPLLQTLREGDSWEAAAKQVTDQVECMPADDARACLLFMLLAHRPR